MLHAITHLTYDLKIIIRVVLWIAINMIYNLEFLRPITAVGTLVIVSPKDATPNILPLLAL
jgi:hypothetical protein